MGVCRVIASAAPSQHIKRNYRKSIEKYDSNKTNENNKVNSSSSNNAKIARASLLTSTSRWRCDALTPPLSHNACLHAATLFTPSLFICMRLNAHRSRLNPLAAHRHAHKHRPREQTKAKRAKGSSAVCSA